MVIECNNIVEAELAKKYLQTALPNAILNFVINENYPHKVVLCVNGQIDKINNEIIIQGNLNVVFNSQHSNLYFVDNQEYNVPVKFGDKTIRKNNVAIVAGPCEIESYKDLYETAVKLKEAGVSVFRAMPSKPRTSPYNFQGVGNVGFCQLAKIKKELNLPVLAEVFSQEDIQAAIDNDIDIIQIGARNMQNYDLIKRAASSGITTVLKKGMWCSNDQLLKAAEYFFVYGKGNVVLCERGIQTHEGSTRNTMDLSSIVYLKHNSHRPVMADASHGTGVREMVSPINCAAIYLGADIIEIEVHCAPDKTIKPGDYYQMLDIEQYKSFLTEARKIMAVHGKVFDWE